MQLEDVTRTVDGHPVMIYAILDNCIHGAMQLAGQWLIASWELNGRIRLANYPDKFDLDFASWRDEIPWGCLRDEIQWVTRDRDGDYWIGHWKKPAQYKSVWNSGDIYCVLAGVKMPRGPTDCRDAIAERPET